MEVLIREVPLIITFSFPGGWIRCGTLIDLCRGPHVRHTGKVKAAAVTKVRGGACIMW